jgi:hypothetical protein
MFDYAKRIGQLCKEASVVSTTISSTFPQAKNSNI